jgi:hypothetical protein
MIDYLTLEDWVCHNAATGISSEFSFGQENFQDRTYQQTYIYLQY